MRISIGIYSNLVEIGYKKKKRDSNRNIKLLLQITKKLKETLEMKDSKMSKENLDWLLAQPVEIQYQLFQNFVDLAKLHYN